MKIVPADKLFTPEHSGYRGWLGGNPNFEICDELGKDTFIWFSAWGDNAALYRDVEACRKLGRTIFLITGDWCYVPDKQDNCFYFTTHLNPGSPCWQMQTPYSYHQSLEWMRAGGKPKEGPRKYLASFQGSMTTNPNRRKLFDYACDDIFIKECDGWEAAKAEQWGVIKEHSDLMLDSYFTFCPLGHGTTTIRVMEAIFRGSIPILLDDKTKPFGVKLPGAYRVEFPGADFAMPILLQGLRVGDIAIEQEEIARFKNDYLLEDYHLGFDNPIGFTERIRREVEQHG